MWEPSTNLSPQAVEPPKKVFFELDEDAPETGIQFGAGKTTPMALGKFLNHLRSAKQFFSLSIQLTNLYFKILNYQPNHQ